MIKEFITGIILTLAVLSAMSYNSTGHLPFQTNCQKYTNSTSYSENWGWFGKCYVPVWHSYETRVDCRGGILGIGQACMERDEAHWETYTTSKCIIAKTGDPC